MKSDRDAAEGRQTNFVISPEILRFCREVLGDWESGNEPTQCMKMVRELVDQWYQSDDTTELNQVGEDVDIEGQSLTRRLGWYPMQNEWVAPS